MGVYFSRSTIEREGLKAIVQQLDLADDCPGICYERAKELTKLIPHLYKYAPNDQAARDLQLQHDKLIRVSLMDGMPGFSMHAIAKLYMNPYSKAGQLLLDWVIETGGAPLQDEASNKCQDGWTEEEMRELVEQELREAI